MQDSDSVDAPSSSPRVGLICEENHPVFSDVATRVERAGVEVEFLEPGRPLDESVLSGLSLLMNKTFVPPSFGALAWAERHGIPTWNGTLTFLLGLRLVGYRALEHVGFRVPAVSLEKPAGDYVAKTFADWHSTALPELNGEGDFYQEFVPATPVDHKYYAVDTGAGIEVRVLRTTSKLYGEKRPLGLGAVDPDVAAKVRRLVRLTDSQALGVDCIEADGAFWAVDVNPAMSFRDVGMEAELVASVLARLDATREADSSDVDERVGRRPEL